MYPYNRMRGFQPYQIFPPLPNQAQAIVDMFNAISYARDEDFLKLLETALSQGASIHALDPSNSCVMRVAVLANQSRKIQTLFAKGATLPEVPENGKDLLMEAAENGSAELIYELIAVTGLDINYADDKGQTALHYAVQSGNKETAEALLFHHADVNAGSNSMNTTELQEYFGNHPEVNDGNITPLMIATAKSDSEILKLLLKNEANPHRGSCLPLTIALHKDNPALISLLLEHGADPFYCNDANGKSTLKNGIALNKSIESLRLIAKHIRTVNIFGGCSSSLGIAVQNSNEKAVALLLASGYKPENQHPENETIWDLGAKQEKAEGLLSILAASRSDNWEQADITFVNTLLSELPRLSTDPADLASEGLFPEIFTPILPQLSASTAIQIGSALPTREQLTLLAAIALSYFATMKADSDAPGATANQNMPPDVQWIAEIPNKKARQIKLLLSAVEKKIWAMHETLTQVLPLDFFQDCVNNAPEGANLSSFIRDKLRVEGGIPDAIAGAIGNAWKKSAEKNLSWGIAQDSLDDANRFVMHMAASMLEIYLDNIDTKGKALLAECKIFLMGKLHQQARPLTSFCTNPVVWLRNQENRRDLRPVNVAALTRSMEIELGLPPTLCKEIVEGWSLALRQAQRSKTWRTPAELQGELARSLAQAIARIMQAGAATHPSADFPVPSSSRVQLLAWCGQADVPIDISLTSQTIQANPNNPNHVLRRPAEAEAPGAPPAKKPRI